MRAVPLRKEIVSLTSLRGVAAMAVIAMHFSATMQQIATGRFPSLAPHGSLAVDVFFVLSGFIMGYTYVPSFRIESTWVAYSSFLSKRAARILPLNAAVSVLLVAVALLSLRWFGGNPVPTVRPYYALQDIILNALLLPGVGIGHSLNWPTWSVSIEFAVYFCFPLLFLLVFGRRRPVFILVSLVALAGVYGCLGPNLGIWGLHNHPYPWRDELRCVSEFTLGLCAYRLYETGAFAAVFSRDAVAALISALILAIVLLNLPEFFAMVLFPPLILSLSLNSGIVARILSTRFLHFLGTISYSLYLIADPFRWPIQQLLKLLHPSPIEAGTGMALAALATVLMILPAAVTYALIEKPGRILLRRIFASDLVGRGGTAPAAGSGTL